MRDQLQSDIDAQERSDIAWGAMQSDWEYYKSIPKSKLSNDDKRDILHLQQNLDIGFHDKILR